MQTSFIDTIRAFPAQREVSHCGSVFFTSPFAIYGVCPVCKTKLKLRAYSAAPEIEDVFDAVFEWMNQPEAATYAKTRIAEIAADDD